MNDQEYQITLLNEAASGVYVIAVTSFTENGALDLDSADRVVDFYLEKGATGLTLHGMMGEAPKLTAEESRILVRRVLARAAGSVPIVMGVSAPGLATMGEFAKELRDLDLSLEGRTASHTAGLKGPCARSGSEGLSPKTLIRAWMAQLLLLASQVKQAARAGFEECSDPSRRVLVCEDMARNQGGG